MSLFYHPVIVNLTSEELEQYREITKKIRKLWNINTSLDAEGLSSNTALNKLLIQRKRIIHKAANKLIAFKEINSNLYQEKNEIKYMLVYCPEGYVDDDKEGASRHLIDQFTKAISELDREVTVAQLTGE